jgi:hypothetical protein
MNDLNELPYTGDHNNGDSMVKLHTYVFTYYGFIPGYNDFDQEWITIIADNLEDAWNEAYSRTIYNKYPLMLESIDGERI